MAYTTIKKPSDYFNTKLYTGNDTGQSITGVGFQPDWVWLKGRDTATDQHFLFDVVRGVYNELNTNSTQEEQTKTDTLTSFNSDGFTVADRSGVNRLNDNFVSWNWLGANGTASNTQGDITSTVSANTTSGFSIVSYTGTGSAGTVGHGLGSAPSVILTKTRSNAEQWFCHWSVLGTGSFIKLDTTDASGTNATAFPWNPQTDTFGLSSDGATNTNGRTYIAYCFSEVKGFSKFGSYVGNGNADGTFVYTGFKPAFVIIKASSFSGENWYIFDNKRTPSNEINKYLEANTSNTEFTVGSLDFLSNGFKNRINNSLNNQSGSTYIYMAFAEEPLVGDNPATAR